MGIYIKEANLLECETYTKLVEQVYLEICEIKIYSLKEEYVTTIRNIEKYLQDKNCKIFVAISDDGIVVGGALYISDLSLYELPIKPTIDCSAIRFLVVDPRFRGLGIGEKLTKCCVESARQSKRRTIILHTTKSMSSAVLLYEKLGFSRNYELDFESGNICVLGYRLDF